MKDTEEQNDVRLGDKLGLAATVDITLKHTFTPCVIQYNRLYIYK